MNLPLRTLAVFAAGVLCLETCFALDAAKAPEVSTPPTAQQDANAAEAPPPPVSGETISLPGPIRPFLRMAGISQEITPDEVLPMLARNVSLWGYQGDKPTEFLVLVERYVQLARELRSLTDSNGMIKVTDCNDAGRLIQALGYQFQHGCSSSDASLITADPERAFLTIDSGFPLTALEEALQKGHPFSYSFPSTPLPVLFTEKTWVSLSVGAKKYGNNLLDILLRDRSVDRLYSAMSRNDLETRVALQRSPGLRKLLPYSNVLDFYGSWISIHNGEVAVPGGAAGEEAWKDLAGANPKSSGEFVTHLLSRDRGWLAAYFDAMSRIGATQQAHFTDPTRVKHLYDAYQVAAHGSHNTAAEGVFPRNAGLLVLLTRLQWQADGTPVVPGSLATWKEIASRKTNTTGKHPTVANAKGWSSPEELLDELVGSSLDEADLGPLQIYLMVNAIDSGRPADKKLSEATVRLLADRFIEYNNWYPIFAEFPALDDTSIGHFVETADRINKMSNPTLRSNALGTFQAEVCLWQILARQGQIPAESMNRSWQKAVQPFVAISSPTQLFDAARASLEAILVSASGDSHLSQNQAIDLLAGPTQDNPDGRRAHQELARRMRTVMDDQRLVSLDTLFGLYDGLHDMAKGQGNPDTMLLLAAELREFELPRPIFSGNEKTTWAPIVYTSRHAELQVRTDLSKIISSHGSPDQLEAARGRLTPFLRDTLVGLTYSYYEPPGAQVLHNNPLFVRSHDFSASSVQGIEHVWGTPELVGIGVTAGGGAYLLGSLADLPYALASVEQDFISPSKVQALIWKEIVPEFLVDAVLPRWWGVGKDEMHAAALYQKAGEELLIGSASNPQLKEKVLGILSDRMSPARFETTVQALEQTSTAKAVIAQMLPSDTFYLAAAFRTKFPDQASASGDAGKELDALIQKDPSKADAERLAREFGVPHLEMAQSNTCSLLNDGIFPASGAFQGRLFGESWESSNLYWERLADEMGYSPAMLNVLVPNLTRHMVSNIFATNVDDWPALLRAMKETGDEFRQGKFTVRGTNTMAGQIGGVPIAAAEDPNR
ncbi:MAG TPA: hypothetical protein VH308_08140 [Terracidiphilus sp.]|nr:hypothetical protein [Terracidiphilus sp.]